VTGQHTSPNDRTRIAVAKVLYLLAVTVIVFAVPMIEATRPARWWVVSGLMLLQAAILFRCGIGWREVLRPAWRLKWLFVVLMVCYAFLPNEERRGAVDWQALTIPFLGVLWVNLAGVAVAGLMCLQIITVLLASAVVRLTGPGADLVIGLRALRLPNLFVYALDLVLARLGGMSRQGGGGDGRGRRRGQQETPGSSPGFFAVLRQLVRGDVGVFTSAIRTALTEAQVQVERDAEDAGEAVDPRLAHDVAVIAGVGLVMVTLKMLKFLPGIPIASGHKTILLFPLYLLASRLTHTRWGGTTAGAVMGVVGFLQGDGRFGVLEIFKHVAAGLVIDLLMPLVRRLPDRAWVYCGVGLLAGAARCATEFAVVLLLGARAEVYLFPAVKLVPTLIAGTLSGFVALAVLKAFPSDRHPDPPPEESTQPPSLIPADTVREK
jgi:hypothetical protein